MVHVTADDGARIHYEQWGRADGCPVVFVHGLGTDTLGWIRQRRAFGAAHRCIAVDNRGSGRSDKPPGPYRLRQLASDVIAVLDHAGVDRAHLVGASMGGVVAQILAVEHPGRVESLTLACSACRLEPWRERLFDEWTELIETQGMRRFAVHNLEWIFGPRSLRRLFPVAAVLGPALLRAPEHAFLAQIAALRDFDDSAHTELGSITAPTLVLTGSQDLLTPVADAEELAARIPGAELVVIRGAAHGFMVENARPFNRVVLDFIDRQALSRSGSLAEVIDLHPRSGGAIAG